MSAMEQLRALEEICRDLVFVQIKIAGLKKIWEQKLPPEPSAQAAPAAGEAAFAAGPPQVLKIALPLYPPRFQVHPGPLYSLNRAEPSTYQQVVIAFGFNTGNSFYITSKRQALVKPSFCIRESACEKRRE